MISFVLSVGFALWVLSPIIVFCGSVAWMEWYDRRQWRRDQQRLSLWLMIEEAWDLPPHERDWR